MPSFDIKQTNCSWSAFYFTKNRINTQLLHIVLDIPCLEHNRQGTFAVKGFQVFCEQKTDRKRSPLTAKSLPVQLQTRKSRTNCAVSSLFPMKHEAALPLISRCMLRNLGMRIYAFLSRTAPTLYVFRSLSGVPADFKNPLGALPRFSKIEKRCAKKSTAFSPRLRIGNGNA